MPQYAELCPFIQLQLNPSSHILWGKVKRITFATYF